MSSSSSTEMIEHVVLLNISDDDPLKVDAVLGSINSLASLPEVLSLTVVPILRLTAAPTTLRPRTFTHVVHARYASLTHLHSYAVHPAHVRLQAELSAQPTISHFMILDWVDHTRPKPLLPGRALRLTAFRLKGGAGDKNSKRELLEGLSRVRGAFEEMSYGEEISIERAKGFAVAAVVVFDGLSELEACEGYEDMMRSLVDRLKDTIGGVISVDYVVPLPGPTNTSAIGSPTAVSRRARL